MTKKIKLIFFSFLTLIFITSAFIVWAIYYPKASWVPAHINNYTDDDYYQRQNEDIFLVIIHVGEGSYGDIIKWFQNPRANTSSHYVVSRDGRITAMVKDENIAWHAGNWKYNFYSIGIEHEGYVKNTFPDSMYKASAGLVRWLIQTHKIPPNHFTVVGDANPQKNPGIIGHNQVPDPKNPSKGGGIGWHTDPGPNWNWNYYMNFITGGGKPDLVFTKTSFPQNESFLPKDKVLVKTRVKNQGAGDTIGSFFVSLYFDGKKIQTKEVASLNKGRISSEISFSFIWPYDSKDHRVQLKIEDPYNYILESNFNNNEKAINLKALNARPVAEIIKPSSQTINFGDEISFQGRGLSQDSHLGDIIEKYVWVSSIDGKLNEGICALSNCETRTFSTKKLSPGSHQIYFTVKDKFEWSEPVKINIKVKAGIDFDSLENDASFNYYFNDDAIFNIKTEKNLKFSINNSDYQDITDNSNFQIPNWNTLQDGPHTLKLKSVNDDKEIVLNIVKDTILPSVSSKFSSTKPFFNIPQTIEFSLQDDNIKELRYCFERNCFPSEKSNDNKKIILKESRDYFLRFQLVDKAGNLSEIKELPLKLRRVDINQNGIVDIYDFSIMMANWQKPPSSSENAFLSDLNIDGIVDIYDFSIMMANWQMKIE